MKRRECVLSLFSTLENMYVSDTKKFYVFPRLNTYYLLVMHIRKLFSVFGS